MFVGAFIFGISPVAKDQEHITAILMGIAVFFAFASAVLDSRARKVREEEKEEKRIKSVIAMFGGDKVREIYPKVDNFGQRYYLKKILCQIHRNLESDILFTAMLMDDESILLALHVNGIIIEEYRYTDYELFLSTWEVR